MYGKWGNAWQRFGARPSFAGLRVLDFGCGFGAFSIRAAEEGASVVGLDLDQQEIASAREIARERFAELDVKYVNAPVESLDECFDVIITNEVLEHIVDLAGCLRSLFDHLNPGGLMYAGWGPLWYSPAGGHQMTVKVGGLPVPWSHLIKPLASSYVRAIERRRFAEAPQYWNFNYLRPKDYERLIAESPFEVLSWRVNPGSHPAYRVLRVAARIAPSPFTANIYAVLRRPDHATSFL
jgi:SAM-dependent methyltransferase